MTYSPDQHMVDPRNPSNWMDVQPTHYCINPNQFSEDEWELVHQIPMDVYTEESDAKMDAFGIARLLMKPVHIQLGLDQYQSGNIEWYDMEIVKPNVKIA